MANEDAQKLLREAHDGLIDNGLRSRVLAALEKSPLPHPTDDELFACEHYYQRWAEAEKGETNTSHAGAVSAFRAGWMACIESEDRAKSLAKAAASEDRCPTCGANEMPYTTYIGGKRTVCRNCFLLAPPSAPVERCVAHHIPSCEACRVPAPVDPPRSSEPDLDAPSEVSQDG